MADRFVENTTGVVDVEFFDHDSQPVTPTQLWRQIIDVDSNTTIQAETEVTGTLDDTMEVVITHAQNALLNPAHEIERRLLIVRYTWTVSAATRQNISYWPFEVVNVRVMA